MPDVRPGQKVRIAASDWNAVRRAVGSSRLRIGGFGSSLGAGPEKCVVRNDSETDLPQFAVVQLSGAAADASVFRGETPVVSAVSYAGYGQPFAILLQSLASGESGLARFSGVMAARVKACESGGLRASPSPGGTYLVQSPVGPAALLGAQDFTEADVDGLVWALVVLGGTGGSAAGSGDVVVCRVKDSNGREWFEGVDVDVYDNGFMEPATGTGVLYLPEVGQFTKPRNGFAVLAHRGCVFAADSGADEPQTGEVDES